MDRWLGYYLEGLEIYMVPIINLYLVFSVKANEIEKIFESTQAHLVANSFYTITPFSVTH